MQTHHNRRLFDLAVRNSQRRNLESLLEKGELKSWLEATAPIFHPDTPITVPSAASRASRLHSRSESEPGVETHETSSETRAEEWLRGKLKSLPNGQYYLSFGREADQAFDTHVIWATKYPVLLTTPQAIVENLRGILDVAEDSVVAVSQDGSAGVVIDSYVGYLPEEPNPDEIVYELTAWNGDA